MKKFRYKTKTYAPERERISDPNNHGLPPESVKRARANPKDFELKVSLDFLQRVCSDAAALESLLLQDAMGDIFKEDEHRKFKAKTARELEKKLRLYAYGYTEGKDDELKSDTQFQRVLMDFLQILVEFLPKEEQSNGSANGMD